MRNLSNLSHTEPLADRYPNDIFPKGPVIKISYFVYNSAVPSFHFSLVLQV